MSERLQENRDWLSEQAAGLEREVEELHRRNSALLERVTVLERTLEEVTHERQIDASGHITSEPSYAAKIAQKALDG